MGKYTLSGYYQVIAEYYVKYTLILIIIRYYLYIFICEIGMNTRKTIYFTKHSGICISG